MAHLRIPGTMCYWECSCRVTIRLLHGMPTISSSMIPPMPTAIPSCGSTPCYYLIRILGTVVLLGVLLLGASSRVGGDTEGVLLCSILGSHLLTGDSRSHGRDPGLVLPTSRAHHVMVCMYVGIHTTTCSSSGDPRHGMLLGVLLYGVQ